MQSKACIIDIVEKVLFPDEYHYYCENLYRFQIMKNRFLSLYDYKFNPMNEIISRPEEGYFTAAVLLDQANRKGETTDTHTHTHLILRKPYCCGRRSASFLCMG